jgi:aspartyl-tRNA(Asn)/glutamyl-tRNA(Gln) amidotransferase subunit C
MDKDLLKHIAELSRIDLTEEELKKFTPQMETILESAKYLQEIDTTNVQPMKARVPFSTLRDDIPGETLTQEEVLKNAPNSEKGYVKVYGKIFGAIEES